MGIRLKAPAGVTSFELAGFPIPIKDGFAEVEPSHIGILRTHGFTLVEGEASAIAGSRQSLIQHFYNNARAFAEKATDAELTAFADLAVNKAPEELAAAWQVFFAALKTSAAPAPELAKETASTAAPALVKPTEVPEAKSIADMARQDLFAALKAKGIPAVPAMSNDDLRKALADSEAAA